MSTDIPQPLPRGTGSEIGGSPQHDPGDSDQHPPNSDSLAADAQAPLLQPTLCETAQVILERCAGAIGATTGYALLLAPDGTCSHVVVLKPGGRASHASGAACMSLRGLAREACRTGQVLIENDVPASSWAADLPPGHIQVENALYAPLDAAGENVGLLVVGNKPGGFGPDDARVAAGLAALAAVALREIGGLASLAQSEHKYRSVVEQSADGVVLTDQTGVVIDWNRRAEQITGLMRDEVLGGLIWEVCAAAGEGEPSGWLQPRFDDMRDAEGTHRPVADRHERRMTIRRADGSLRTLQYTVFPIQMDGGLLFCNILRDVTDQIDSERDLRQSEARYRAIFGTTGSATIIIDSDTVISLVNAGFERLSGYSAKDIENRMRWTEFVLPEDREPLLEYHGRSQIDPTSVPRRHEFRFVDRHGRIRDVLLDVADIPETTQVVASLLDVSQRRQLQREVERRRLYLESVLASAPDAIVTLDSHHCILEWNPGAERLFNYRREDVIGLELDTLISGTDRRTAEQATNLTQLAYSGQTVPPTEVVRYRRDGSPVSVLVAGSPIAIGGEVVGIVAIYTDLTQVRNAERALSDLHGTLESRVEQRTRELQVLYELTQQVGYTLNYDELFLLILEHLHRVVEYDMAAALLVNGDSAEMLVRNVRPAEEWLVNEFRDRLVRAFSRQAEGQTPSDIVVRLVPQDPPDSSAAPMTRLGAIFEVPLIVAGHIQGILSVTSEEEHELSADHQRFLGTLAAQAGDAMQRLRAVLVKERERLESLVEHLPNGVLLLDTDCRILLVNPVGLRHLTTLTESRPGDTLRSLGSSPIEQLLTSPPRGLWHVVESGHSTFEIISRPLERNGSSEGWVLVIHDATHEREAQHRVQQQERLAAVGQLAAGIAHDFNNIMAVIVLYSQMVLRAGEIGPRSRERVQTVVQQAKRATDLIQQILDFSRRSLLERQPLDLEPFLKEQVKMLSRILPESIKIQLTHGIDDYTVDADPTRMQQTFVNLAVNARDAMPAGGRLQLHLDRLRIGDPKQTPLPELAIAGSEWVRVQVSDTGTGIAPEAVPHIFEPFYTTKEIGKGSGLGLSQVYGIVRQHDGHMDFETKLGYGTTFSIYLPALTPPGPQLALPEDIDVETGRGEAILVVEDNLATREALVACVEVLNYRTLQAANGREALEVLDRVGDQVVLILTDLVMPEMGGRALLNALARRQSATKVVFLTGYPLGDEFQDLINLGAVGWLQKPVKLEQLARVISQALNETPS